MAEDAVEARLLGRLRRSGIDDGHPTVRAEVEHPAVGVGGGEQGRGAQRAEHHAALELDEQVVGRMAEELEGGGRRLPRHGGDAPPVGRVEERVAALPGVERAAAPARTRRRRARRARPMPPARPAAAPRRSARRSGPGRPPASPSARPARGARGRGPAPPGRAGRRRRSARRASARRASSRTAGGILSAPRARSTPASSKSSRQAPATWAASSPSSPATGTRESSSSTLPPGKAWKPPAKRSPSPRRTQNTSRPSGPSRQRITAAAGRVRAGGGGAGMPGRASLMRSGPAPAGAWSRCEVHPE